MGPINTALVLYLRADQKLREAQARLDAATRDMRIQERKIADLSERQRLTSQQLKEHQAKAGQVELDLKTRDSQIDRLREQQQQARNNREYQAFLLEINTAKVDRGKAEEETIKAMEEVERLGAELKSLTEQMSAEQQKLEQLRKQLGGRVKQLTAEIEAVRPQRDAAAGAVPARAREIFDRLSEQHDGEPMSALAKPDRRHEQYICTVCNMEQAVDVYNKLHARDEIVFCPSCRRILYIPDDLPPEVAIKSKPKPKVAKAAAGAAAEDTAATTTGTATEPAESDASDDEPQG